MEISSFSFEDCSVSSSFSFVQDCEISFSNGKKRPRFDDFESSDASIDDLLTKLLAFDDSPDVLMHQSSISNNELFDNGGNFKRARSEADDDVSTFFMQQSSVSNCNRSNLRFSDGVCSNSTDSGDFKKADDAVTTSDNSSAPAIDGGGVPRRLWVKNRSNAWWEEVNSPNFPPEEFKKAFRMSRATFDMICNELESAIGKKDTMLRSAVPVQQRVAVCVWRLATGEALREVSKKFGLGISTCHKLVLEVCAAIKSVLMPKFLQWPDKNRTAEISRHFEAFSGIPNVAGSIYTTHIPIIAPKVNVAAYFNKRHTERNHKTSYSITLQGVVDSTGVFTDVSIGWPGSMTDEQILSKSALFHRAKNGASIVGNSAYPLLDWVLVPYARQNLTWTQHAFNEKVDEVQGVSKEAFMKLKARWRCLMKRTEMKVQDLPVVLAACCVLHNVCEMRNEELSEELRFEIFDDEMVAESSDPSVGALRCRDRIAHKILHS